MSIRNKAIAVLDTYEGVSPTDTYVALVESIDWDRLRLEANGRCLRLHSDLIGDDMDMPCGKCIEAALLEPDTFPSY